MMSITDMYAASGSDGRPAATWNRRLVLACFGAGVLANGSWILGAHELLGPEATATSLLATLGIAVGWPIAILLAIRCLLPTASRIIAIGGTILLFGGMAVVITCFLEKMAFGSVAQSPKPIPWILLSTFSFVALWGLLILLVARRRTSAADRGVFVLGSIVCWGGPLLAATIFFWIPMEKIHPTDLDDPDKVFWAMKPENADEVRLICHRALIWDVDPHDPFINLGHFGTESSVPYILWGLRGMPQEEPRCCTWEHGLYALERITNHSVGSTREAWAQWYAANKNRGCVEWWADGFADEGYPVSVEGGETSIRNLLAVLGRTPWCQVDYKPWLSFNARRMLGILKQKDIRLAIDNVLLKGSVQERCGAARYAYKFDRDYAEAMLHRLTQDEQRLVRLCASGELCHLQLEWLKNPPNYIEKQFAPDAMGSETFFSPPGSKVILPQVGTQIEYRCSSKVPPHVRINAVPERATERDHPRCVIRVDWPKDAADWRSRDVAAAIGIEGISPVTGKTEYSRDIIHALDANELRWIYDSRTDGVYISVPYYTCRIDPRTGQILWEMGFGTDNGDEIFVGEGYLIIYNGDLVICDAARGGILALYELPSGCFDPRPLSLVDGRLRIRDAEGSFSILALPQRE